MTHRKTTTLRILAVLSLLVATAAVAGPGPDPITLEKIGAVRMATPDEVKQQRASAAPRDDRQPQQNFR